jgi:hypothetical protein
MSRHDSQPPHPDWQPEARPCVCFERPDRVACKQDLSIPPNITLGEE